jgi:hypothetical protein
MRKGFKGCALTLASAFQDAADDTISNYHPDGGPGAHKWEDDITGGFIQAIKDIDYSSRGVPHNFSVEPDRHRSVETKTGADLAILCDIDIAKFNLQTAILIQAKRQGTDHYKDFRKAKEQCGKMLGYTTDSFIFDYSVDEICAVPAVSVVGADDSVFDNTSKYPDEFHKKSVNSLMKDFFMGYRGNEHTYRRIWNLAPKACSTPRRTNPVYGDGGNPNDGNYENEEGERGLDILSIRVTGETV